MKYANIVYNYCIVTTLWNVNISKLLEHNLFKNVSKGPAFLWQSHIQTIEYDLKDTIRINKNEFIMILYSFTPSDMNFQRIFMPKEI